MTKRTFILLSIFIFLVIFGGTFMAVYKLYWNDIIDNYINDLTQCHFLSEATCQTNLKCEVIYREHSKLANQVEYEKCVLIPEHKKQVMSKAQRLCEETNGQWQKLKAGYYCDCIVNGETKVWDKEKGCKIMN